MCRKLIDKSTRDHKRNEAIPRIKDPPSYFTWDEHKLNWIQKRHITACTLQDFGNEICRSAKNDAVVLKSQNVISSKQAYEGEKRTLLKTAENLITVQNINTSYKPFSVAKHALNKAHKSKNATSTSTSSYLDGNKKIRKEATVIVPTFHLDEAPDHFLIYQSSEDSVVLGTKFLIEKFFKSKIVMSDGTFKIAVKGWRQTYILWFLIKDTVPGEAVPRVKAVAAAYFLMKSKLQSEYEELFELFR